ncbi:MAG: FeoA family protein [Nitratireductor sp.]
MSAAINSKTPPVPAAVRLGEGACGLSGVVVAVGGRDNPANTEFDQELERRLLEIGFVEGAHVEILHEGLFGRDPIAVKVDTMRVALRRHEANAILIEPDARVAGRGRS